MGKGIDPAKSWTTKQMQVADIERRVLAENMPTTQKGNKRKEKPRLTEVNFVNGELSMRVLVPHHRSSSHPRQYHCPRINLEHLEIQGQYHARNLHGRWQIMLGSALNIQ